MKAPLDLSKFITDQSKLARDLNVSPQAVQQWVKANRVPAGRCLAVEAATNGAVSRYDLRPDVFGEAPENQQHAA